MAQEKQFVRIQSSVTINVTAGLHNQDVTNKDAHVPDRLKVNPLWSKMTCLIREGVGIYPAMICEWPTVKALAKDAVLTIGEYLDSADDEVVKKQTQLTDAMKKIEAQRKQTKGTLAEIAGE